MDGYVKLSRKIEEWEHFKDGNCMKVLTYLMIHAKFKPETYGGYDFEAGEVRYTYDELERACGITYNQARECIKKLKTTGILTVKTTPKFSVGRLEKWASQEPMPQKTTGKTTAKPTPSYNKEKYNKPDDDFYWGGLRIHD